MDEIQFNNGEGNGEAAPVEAEASEEYSLASPFLNGMPEEHRTLLTPYVKKWDGTVTKKFQDYSNRLKPYEQLGKPEELQKYVAFANNFRNDPESLFRVMWNGLQEQYGDKFEEELLRILQMQEEAEEEMSEDYEYEEGEEEGGEEGEESYVLDNVMEELRSLREWKEQFEASQEDAAGQEQLDGVLEEMHTQLGDFDDDFIIAQLAKHGDVQQAIEAWNSMIGKYSSQQAQPRDKPQRLWGVRVEFLLNRLTLKHFVGADRRAAVAECSLSLGMI